MNTITEGKTLLKTYTIQQVTGTVISETNRSDTHVSGYVPPRATGLAGTILSKTTEHQTIYLKDKDDQEHAITVQDLTLPCREGHEVTFSGLNGGHWFDAKNHTTNQSFYNKSIVNAFTFPKWLFFALIGLICAPVFFYIVTAMSSDGAVSSVIAGAILGTFVTAFVSLFVGAIFLIPTKIIGSIRSANIISAFRKVGNTA